MPNLHPAENAKLAVRRVGGLEQDMLQDDRTERNSPNYQWLSCAFARVSSFVYNGIFREKRTLAR